MAEKIVSPGVFTNEVDQSFLPAGVQAIGAAVIGPTAKGPAGIPTIVSSYSEYLQKFGGKIESGSGAVKNQYKYLTDYAAQEYLKYADTLTVVRILGSTFSAAQSIVSSSTTVGSTFASASVQLRGLPFSGSAHELTINGIDFVGVVSASLFDNSSTERYYSLGTTIDSAGAALATAIGAASSLTTVSASYQATGNILELTGSTAGVNTVAISSGSSSGFTQTPFFFSGSALQGGTNSTTSANCFTLTTLTDGSDMNSSGPEGTNNLLASGSENNVRWEVNNVNTTKGTFNLLIRRGDDTSNRKQIVEQFNNLTLDPNTPNYIARQIGDQTFTVQDSGEADPFLQLTGDFGNRSKYVRVTVHQKTLNYLDANGNVRDNSLSGSLPSAGSGSFNGGSDGTVAHPIAFNENISNTNTQGFNLASGNEYSDAIKLLKNQDEYDINLLTLPGLIDNFTNHATILTEAVNMVEDRADCFLVLDPVEHGTTSLTTVTGKAESRDSNYVAEYWPWVKIPDPDLGRNVWVPASTVIPSVYAFNDRVAAPWFAPAGLNRGGIDIAVRTERKLTHANRDTLYESNVNPIATFPNAGVTVFGQKTLQKKASALDRVNVRRLLIAAKKFIASTTKFLIFENNTAATRNRFLSIVNPYFENVQQRQGLYAFKVVMDETNNTPDVIDRNEMRGQIFLQPAKAAEFIIIDFNIMPTGAAFPE